MGIKANAVGLYKGQRLKSMQTGILPTIAYNFLSPALDPSLTFTASSAARTMFNSSGTLVYGPMNLSSYSQDFSQSYWARQNTGYTANATTDPFGGNSGTKLIEVATSSTKQYYVNAGLVFTAASYTFSIYAKAAERTWIAINNGASSSAYFNLSTGTLGTVTSGTASITSVGNGWYLCSLTATMTASTQYPAFFPSTGDQGGNGYLGVANYGLYVFGYQVELSSSTSPNAYNPTTSSAYYGPRFDYNPSTLALNGLLIEQQSTNLQTYSAVSSGSALLSGWTSSSATISSYNNTAPDGTATALQFASTATGGKIQSGSMSISASTTYTDSIYVKLISLQSGASLNNIYLQAYDGTAFPQTSFATSGVVAGRWIRITNKYTSSGGATNRTLYVVDNNTNFGSVIQVWGAQLEVLAFPTSYIPTISATATRAIETLVNSSIGSWFNATQGTFVTEVIFEAINSSRLSYFSAFSDGTVNNQISAYVSSSAPAASISISGVGNTSGGSLGAPSANIVYKAGIIYKNANNSFAVGGVLDGAGAMGASALPSGLNALYLGDRSDSARTINGWIRSFAYYNTALTSTQLSTLTGQL